MSFQKAILVFAPLSGPVIPLEDVPDEVFRSRMVGDGVAIDPISEVLCAPQSGTIAQIHPAKHALTLKTDSGFHILMHIGLDTVSLKGQGFSTLVQEGQSVELGQPLIRFDADFVATHARSLISVVLLVDSAVPRQLVVTPESMAEAATSELFRVSILDENQPLSDPPETPDKQEYYSDFIKVKAAGGLHARPAGLLAATAKKFTCPLFIEKSGKKANAKSLVAIMALEIGENDDIRLVGQGAAAPEAIEELKNCLEGALASPTQKVPEKDFINTPTIISQTATKKGLPGQYFGVSASPGLALGKVYQLREMSFEIPKIGHSVDAELSLFHEAIGKAEAELKVLQQKIATEGNSTQAAIFAAHCELLEDPELVDATLQGVRKGESAAHAWHQSFQQQAKRLSQLNNELLSARANDLRDVGQRVLRHLLGCTNSMAMEPLADDTILIADNLTPSDTAGLDRQKVRGFCTLSGGATSHVAILARSLGIPAIAAIDPDVMQIKNGTEIVMNGSEGFLKVSPSAEDKDRAIQYQEKLKHKRKAELSRAHEPAHMVGGQWIEVAANIGGIADAEEAVRHGCDGVGLLRSEFLFLERDTAPSEDEQLAIYQRISDILGSRPFTVRTLDVGGDKPLKYLPIESEENPFLGLRGIRVGLKHEAVLRTRLRALLRVRHQGELRIMFPMISTLSDWEQARNILDEERANLSAPEVKVGIMIEVPSAALLAHSFARDVDFFSIGTNDLTQYTLAVDRGNKVLADQFDTLHPSIFKLIELTTQAAQAYNRWVGVCGGIAGDEFAVPILLGLGVNELSVSVPSLPSIKEQIRHLDLTHCKEVASRALMAQSGAEIKQQEYDNPVTNISATLSEVSL